MLVDQYHLICCFGQRARYTVFDRHVDLFGGVTTLPQHAQTAFGVSAITLSSQGSQSSRNPAGGLRGFSAFNEESRQFFEGNQHLF